MRERYDSFDDVPPPDPQYDETVAELEGELTAEELAAQEARVLAESKRPAVPVWGLWGLGITVMLAIATMVFMRSTGPKGESISRIHSAASELSGQALQVRGRVGDVFPMVGSHVYYLLQGRDTLVVFTRGTPPRVGTTITVQGTLSVGYLDGSPRPALFETSSQ